MQEKVSAVKKAEEEKALNNKVRNRFFHVTQFTRMAYIRHTTTKKETKQEWCEQGKKRESQCDT